MAKVTRLLVAVVASVAMLAGAAGAVTHKPVKHKRNPHATYALPAKATKCRVDFVKRTERHKVKGKEVRYVACVYYVPKSVTYTAPAPQVTTPSNTTPTNNSSTSSSSPTSSTPAPTTTTLPTDVHANVDPSATVANPNSPQVPSTSSTVPIVFDYSASVASGNVPDGEITLTISQANITGYSAECVANVTNATASTVDESCTKGIPAWGSYDLVTSYSSGVSNVAATGETETVDIEPPALSPITVNYAWGTSQTGTVPSVSAIVEGSSANITVTDSNWEGPTGSVNLTDQLGDSCTLSIVGTQGTCTMAVTGTPSSFTVGYPGGTTTQTTQNVSPWGVSQSQTVNNAWPSENVAVSHPTVSVQSASLVWSTWYVQGSSSGTGQPPATLNTSTGDSVKLFVITEGSLAGDSSPAGYVNFSVTSGQPASDYTDVNNEGSSLGSTDCSESENNSGEANGSCKYVFNTPGTYTIKISFVSQDSNYASEPDGLSETINVS